MRPIFVLGKLWICRANIVPPVLLFWWMAASWKRHGCVRGAAEAQPWHFIFRHERSVSDRTELKYHSQLD